ncbi:hypothetical protein [Paenibacillus harenae]|uniref:hypothetical protein n=1 Tax=Paenibacillus harenae TaxID=306543 RepID=UPI002793C6A9|nr:hypothetical protein [Paenibacillus harenae]MDQ0062714.1 hypothetical protein [Paenibacillus harenae]
MNFRMNILFLVFVTCMTVLSGCTSNDSQSEGSIVKEENTVGKENNIEILGLTNGNRKVTSSQLSQITKDMTYKEIIYALGDTKDIGSGLYIFRYEYENGEYLDFNFGGYGIISEEDYQDIQNMLNKKR